MSKRKKQFFNKICSAASHSASLLFMLVLFGLILRLYRLQHQSLWIDEFFFQCFLSAESLRTHLLISRTIGPDLLISPLFYILLYAWHAVVGFCVPLLRMLPVAISLTTIPLAFLFGRRLMGTFAGMVAALCFTLSPQYIWHSQELRPYVLATVLTICAYYSLLQATEQKKMTWWFINFLCNFLAILSFPRTGVILVVEGLYLLFFARLSLKKVIVWSLVQWTYILPWLFWAFSTPFIHEFSGVHTIAENFRAFFLGDIVNYHRDLLPAWKTGRSMVLSPFLRLLLFPRRFFDVCMATLIISGVLFGVTKFCILFFRVWIQNRKELEDTLKKYGYLVLILFVPCALLWLTELATQAPTVGSMYLLPGLMTIYLFLSDLLKKIFGKKSQIATLFVLCLFYGYQIVIFIPLTTRTDNAAAASFIMDKGKSTDEIISFQIFSPDDVLQLYLREEWGPVKRVTTLHGACELAYDSFYSMDEPARSAHRVWFAYLDYLGFLFQQADDSYDIRSVLDKGLLDRGLACQYHEFPGHWNITVVEIYTKTGVLPPKTLAMVPTPLTFDWETLCTDLELSFSSAEEAFRAEDTLRRFVISWPPYGSLVPLSDSFDLLAAGKTSFARKMAQYFVKKKPEVGMGHFALGLVFLAEHNEKDARSAFESAYKFHPGLATLYDELIQALLLKDASKANEELSWLSNQGLVYYEPALRYVCSQYL